MSGTPFRVGDVVNVVELEGGGEHTLFQRIIRRETKAFWIVDGEMRYRKSDGARVPRGTSPRLIRPLSLEPGGQVAAGEKVILGRRRPQR